MDRWLTKDEIGVYSGIEYGRKGDKVAFIEETNVIMSLVELNGLPFHVRTENLSSTPLETEIIVPIEKKPVAINWLPKSGLTKTAINSPEQTKLF